MKRVILVRPKGPRNVGAALRASANFGPCELALVAPQRRSMLVHPEFEQMSHGVEAAAKKVLVFDSLPEALLDQTRSFAFTARARRHRLHVPWEERAGDARAWSEEPSERVALVFGSEVDGLSSDECDAVQELCYLPCSSEHGSLNLSMAVSVVLYSLYRAERARARRSGGEALVGAKRAYLIEHVAETLGSVANSPQAAELIQASVRRVFARAELETRDARAWHQIMRALGNPKDPMDYGLSGPADRATEWEHRAGPDGAPQPQG